MTEVPHIQGCRLCKSFPMPHGVVHVLQHLDIEIRRGESVCIMGPSGTGKSTLLHLLSGLDVPDQGEVRMNGEPIQGWPESRRAAFRGRHIGIVFQSYHLMPDLDVLENALLPLRSCSRRVTPSQRDRVRDRLIRMGLGDRLHHRSVELSGGEQQRLAVVRALTNDPEILMADEPTGNLDKATGDRLLDDLFDLGSDSNRTLVVVSHDPHLAERCDRTIQLHADASPAAARAEHRP
jgi:putative ABC transport system ATP-binding protein